AACLTSSTATLRLETPSDRVLLVRLPDAHVPARDVLTELAQLIPSVEQACDAIVLASDHQAFLDDVDDAEAIDAIQRALIESPVPVIAALEHDATGEAWLLATSCDACVYSRTGVYTSAAIA